MTDHWVSQKGIVSRQRSQHREQSSRRVDTKKNKKQKNGDINTGTGNMIMIMHKVIYERSQYYELDKLRQKTTPKEKKKFDNLISSMVMVQVHVKVKVIINAQGKSLQTVMILSIGNAQHKCYCSFFSCGHMTGPTGNLFSV